MKSLIKIQKEKIAGSGQRVLSLCIGEQYCSFSVSGFPGNRLFALEYFTHEHVDGLFLADFFSKQAWQHNSFFGVYVNFDFPQSMLVPFLLYSQENSGLLLRAIAGDTTGNEILSEKIEGPQLFNVYAVPKDVYDAVKKRFPVIRYRHSITASISAGGNDEKRDYLILEFTSDRFSVIAAKEKEITFSQSFDYSGPEDVVYYLLAICRQFHLSPEKVKLVMSGLIDYKSALFGHIHEYFHLPEFRNSPDWGVLASDGTEYPAHYFTALNDLARCAS